MWNQHLSRERLTLPPCSQPQTPFQSYILELLSDEAQNSPEKIEDIQLQLHKHTLTGKGHRVSLYDLHIPSTSKNLLNKIPRSTKINSQSTFVVIHAKYSMWPKTKIKAICLMRIFPTETQLVMSADSVGSILFTIGDGLKSHTCMLSGLPQCRKAEMNLKEKLCTLHDFTEAHVLAKLQCYLVITHI